MSGKFIVFEGIDNSGKTTVSKRITSWLQEDFNIKTLVTHHPGSTPIGKEIRHILKHSPHPINANAQALLFAADNSIFMNQVLKPNLDEGKWVIGDRNNFVSSLAYQIASGCSFDELDYVHKATKQTAKIDLLFVFHCGYEESQRRRALKGEEGLDRFEDAGKEYFDKLAKCYGELTTTQFARLGQFVTRNGLMGCNENIHDINAMQPLEDVVSEIKEIILDRLLRQSTQTLEA